MSVLLTKRAWACKVGRTAKPVLVLLADMANPKNDNCCWPSVEYIMEMTELRERAVQTKLIELEKAGHITRILRSGQSTMYRVHPRSACTPASRAGVQDTHHRPAGQSEDPRTRCGETRKNQNLNRPAQPVGEVVSKILSNVTSTSRADGSDLAADIGALRARIAPEGR